MKSIQEMDIKELRKLRNSLEQTIRNMEKSAIRDGALLCSMLKNLDEVRKTMDQKSKPVP